jgi:ribosome-binding protein aMBF1 (putative translation factor)
MTNKAKFLTLAAGDDTNIGKKIQDRRHNREQLRESQQIALKVLLKLNELGWSQKKLAQKMQVSPQQISKLVRGNENLTLETQIRLQKILKIPILASFYENASKVKKKPALS